AGELALGSAVPRHVAIARIFLHRDAQLLDARHLVVEAATRQHMRDRGAAVEQTGEARILRQISEAAATHDAAPERLGLATEYPEEARLAGTVAADESHLVGRNDGERRVVEDESSADIHRHTLDLQHPTRLAAAAPIRNQPPRAARTRSRNIRPVGAVHASNTRAA